MPTSTVRGAVLTWGNFGPLEGPPTTTMRSESMPVPTSSVSGAVLTWGNFGPLEGPPTTTMRSEIGRAHV